MFQQTLVICSLIALSSLTTEAKRLEHKHKHSKGHRVKKDNIFDKTINLASVESETTRHRDGGSGGDGSRDRHRSGDEKTIDYSTLSFKDMYYYDAANPSYQDLTYQEKIDLLWQRITEDQTPAAMPWKEFSANFHQKGNVTITRESDTIGKDRKSSTGKRLKIVHPNGAVAKVTWKNMGNHSYTGMFSQDTKGLIRFSETGLPLADIDPDFQTAELGHTVPSFALKFPRTEGQSSDLFGMHDFEGFSGFNFFKEDFFSSLPLMTDPWLHHTVGAKLAQVNEYVGHTSQAFHTRRFQDDSAALVGSDVQKNVFDLRYEPIVETVNHFTEEYTGPLLEKLTAIPQGSHVFNVYAREGPFAEEEKIGEIWTDSEMVTSKFGDEQLFFRHWTADEDFINNPEWEDFIPEYHEIAGQIPLTEVDFTQLGHPGIVGKDGSQDEARQLLKESIIQTGCPFKWMFERMYGVGVTPDDLA